MALEYSNMKGMANGSRNLAIRPLTDEEIKIVIEAGKRIGILDESIYIFNDEEHVKSPLLGTGYNYQEDKIYVTMNVFPDDKYASIHPRDLMSVSAVLAHEYYGHRPFREEYLNDKRITQETGSEYHTTVEWQDECRASINAAKFTPNLTEKERSDLVCDALYRAHEYGQTFELDDYLKGVLYGNFNEKPIIPVAQKLRYVSERSLETSERERSNFGNLPSMPSEIDDVAEEEPDADSLPLL